MNNKNKAVRIVNLTLGLIVMIAVVLASPLFGYARGFASEEQRQAVLVSGRTETVTRLASPEATPRPTPKPTPTPVVLPTAPPTPEPTPVPVQTPRPAAPAVQQNTYNTWAEDEYWEPEPEYYEDESAGESAEDTGDTSGGETEAQSDVGGQIVDGVIQNGNADLVINVPVNDGGTSTATVVETVVTENVGADAGENGGGDAGGDGGGYDGGAAEAQQPSRDANESEAWVVP